MELQLKEHFLMTKKIIGDFTDWKYELTPAGRYFTSSKSICSVCETADLTRIRPVFLNICINFRYASQMLLRKFVVELLTLLIIENNTKELS